MDEGFGSQSKQVPFHLEALRGALIYDHRVCRNTPGCQLLMDFPCLSPSLVTPPPCSRQELGLCLGGCCPQALAPQWQWGVLLLGWLLLTILQCGHGLCFCTEVTVPNVIGGLQAQLVGGERPQPAMERNQ